MAFLTLAMLHEVLYSAYTNKEYVSYDESTQKLYTSRKKEIHLQHVFDFAQQEAEKALSNQNGESLQDRVKFLGY